MLTVFRPGLIMLSFVWLISVMLRDVIQGKGDFVRTERLDSDSVLCWESLC